MSNTSPESPSATATGDEAYQTYKDMVTNYVENGLNITTGVKIGIGVGAGIAGLLIIAMIVFIIIRLRRSKRAKQLAAENGEAGSASDLNEADKKRIEAFNNL